MNTEPGEIVLRKRLTGNDLGRTGSHQAGFHLPKSMVGLFPALDESGHNPDRWLTMTRGHSRWTWRFIHYNNAVFGTGTRDEYRLTHVRGFLATAMPAVGDQLELRRTGDDVFRVDVIADRSSTETLLLRSSGPWTLVRVRNARLASSRPPHFNEPRGVE